MCIHKTLLRISRSVMQDSSRHFGVRFPGVGVAENHPRHGTNKVSLSLPVPCSLHETSLPLKRNPRSNRGRGTVKQKSLTHPPRGQPHPLPSARCRPCLRGSRPSSVFAESTVLRRANVVFQGTVWRGSLPRLHGRQCLHSEVSLLVRV